MAPNGKCIFNTDWLHNDSYKDWLLMDSTDKHKAKCRLCNKTFNIANMGECALKSHMSYKKHCDRLKAVRLTNNKKAFDPISEKSISSPNPDGTEKSLAKENNLQNYVQKTDTLDAEILWVLNCVKWHHSFRSNTNIDRILKNMFPDSAIAANFTCSERKSSYYAVFGLAPHFKNVMLNDLKGKDFVLLFDETHNSKSSAKQLDVYARFWQNDQVKTSFLTSVFLGHSTADILFENLLDSILPLSFFNVLQLSMDGPNVNLKLRNLVDEYVDNEYGKKLINIGTCPLHTVHNSLKKGFENWKISTFLFSLYQLFKYSSARREDFSSIDGSCFPLKFVPHRWVENVQVCDRALEILPQIKTYIKQVEKGKFTEPTSKSFEIVKENLRDNLFPVKLDIFVNVAKTLQPFLEKYQADKPMLPYLAEDLKKIIMALLQKFIKPKLLENLSILDLLKFDYKAPKNHLATEKIDVGFVAEKDIRELHSSKKISDGDILTLRREFKSSLITMLAKIISKSPISFSIVRNLQCFIPANLVNEKQTCLKKVKLLLNNLVDLNIFKITQCDDIFTDFTEFINFTVPENTSEFLKFDYKKMRLDEFFSSYIKPKHGKLWPFYEKILLLSHGQATVERGFSINKKIEVENMKEKSYVALRLICDHIRDVGGDVTKVVINKELRASVMSGRQKYCQYLEEEKEKKVNEKKTQKRLLDSENEKELNKKRQCLTKCINELSKSADDYAEKAEKENDMTLLLKSNCLRRSAKEKQAELNELEEKKK